MRRVLLFSIAGSMSAVVAPACAGPGPATPTTSAPASAPAQVLSIADALVDDHLAESPELETRLRPPGARFDHLPGDSLAEYAAREAREDRWRATLSGIDRNGLGNTPAGLAFDVTVETLEARKLARVCRFELWSVRQMGGFQVMLADLAQSQPMGTPDLRAQALARFARVPAYVTTQMANLREGLRLGYAQNEGNVRQVIEQLDRLTTGPTEASPFFSPAALDPEPAFRAKWTALVASELTPALAKYRDFLRGAPVKTLLERFSHDASYLHKDAADVTALATSAVTRAQKALPQAFGILPTAPVVVEPIPKFQERTAAAHYRPAALDGSEPATYRIRLYEAEKTSVILGESTAFHETIPGHHLQFNIANARSENPRVARLLFNSGFSEG